MKPTQNLLVVLALCAAPLSIAVAAQPAPAEGGGKVGGKVHGKAASKTASGLQKKPGSPGEIGSTPHPLRQPWLKNAAHLKEDGKQGREPGTGGTKDGASTTGMTKSHKLPNATGNPPVGSATARNGARISGTGMHPRGTVAAVIRPAPKNYGTISGTRMTRGN